jgi:parallel beta-helix repeat protein
MGLTTLTWLCLSELGATLESPPQQLAQTSVGVENQIPKKKLFVNPSVTEKNGDGSESAPFKTITQALQVAEINSVITLAAGTYSTDSGETFPLKLKPGVSIQGDPKTRGSNILIKGGGTFMSPTFARQDITILGANQASLTGVTVTNSNPRGYGLWIESSNPTVSENTFTGSNHDGISITGNSAPNIRNNYFYQNGANGITIYGKSKPELRENVFEQTGFGINIAQKAAPLLIGNRIIKNRAGIVSQANAQPVLRNNVIEGNTEDGLVAIANSQPDLGTKAQPGGNQFRQNGRSDINSSAAKQVISAFGNQLAQDHIIGNIDLAGTASPIASANQPPVSKQVALNPVPTPTDAENHQVAPNPVTTDKITTDKKAPQPKTPAANAGQRLIPIALKPAVPQNSPRKEQTAITAIAPIEIPVPPPESAPDTPTPGKTPQKLSFIQITELKPKQINLPADGNNKPPTPPNSEQTVKLPTPPSVSQPLAPPPKTGSITQGLPVLQPAPVVTSQLLPVPSPDVPFGNARNQPQRVVARVAPATGNPPLPPTRATALSLRYRVVVDAGTESLQAKVRSLVPGAFRTVSKGKAIMQAGAFSDRVKANEVLQLLTGNGLKAAIEQLN